MSLQGRVRAGVSERDAVDGEQEAAGPSGPHLPPPSPGNMSPYLPAGMF